MAAQDLPHQVIAGRRLRNQCIPRGWRSDPASLVAWLGAMQAQQFEFAKWGLALRLRRAHQAGDIERAIESGEILRTHVMRPTWHFVARADIVWMLELTGPRVQRAAASYNRRQGLDNSVLVRATRVIERSLDGGKHLTRQELGEQLAHARMRFTALQLALISMYAELERVICSGPRRGKHFTYALLSERAPDARPLPREEALAELTLRFFRSHGPATIRDFVWWSGLTTGDARRGVEMIRARPYASGGLTYWSVGRSRVVPRRTAAVHLLPIYDEYLVAYCNRAAVPHRPAAADSPSAGTVVFQHAMVIDGQVAGTWRTRRTGDGYSIDVSAVRRMTPSERREIEAAAARYGRFVGAPVSASIASP